MKQTFFQSASRHSRIATTWGFQKCTNFIIAFLSDWAIFIQFWVRKLIGKPVADTTPDCEFDARRIHKPVYENGVPFLATESNALRIHSDFLCGDLAIAACIS